MVIKRPFFIFLTVIFSSCPLIADVAASFNTADSLISCSGGDGSFTYCEAIKRILLKTAIKKRPEIIHLFLDSLGFFHPRYDSGTAQYFPGKRALIISEMLQRNDSLPQSLFLWNKYPRPFDAAELKNRAENLNQIYAENGYPYATVSIDIKKNNSDSSADSMTVIYHIDSDKKCFFAKPTFLGNGKTQASLLLKDMAFKNGDLFDIRKIETSKKKLLSRLYVANAISYSPLILPDSSSHDTVSLVTVPIEISDRAGLGFEGVVGFESNEDEKAQFQGKAQLSLLNMFHSGESVTFQYSGDKVKQQIDLSASKPWLFNLPLQTSANVGMEIQKDSYGYVYVNLNFLSEFNSLWRAGLGLQYNETSPVSDSSAPGGTFYGIDFLLLKTPANFSKGVFTNELAIAIGSGIAKKDKNYDRSHVDFAIGTHIPLFRSQAVYPRLVTAYLVTDEKNLLPVELNRVGGYNSIRGYSDNQFAFKSVIFGQLEVIQYFDRIGSAFIFLDGGVGFKNDPGINNNDYTKLLGYGIGIRMPSRLGTMTLEWARNYQDGKSLGRIHVQFQNDLSRFAGKFQ